MTVSLISPTHGWSFALQPCPGHSAEQHAGNAAASRIIEYRAECTDRNRMGEVTANRKDEASANWKDVTSANRKGDASANWKDVTTANRSLTQRHGPHGMKIERAAKKTLQPDWSPSDTVRFHGPRTQLSQSTPTEHA